MENIFALLPAGFGKNTKEEASRFGNLPKLSAPNLFCVLERDR